MEVTFDDIARTLNASLVSLPGDPSSAMGYAAHPHAQYRYPAQQLPADFDRLTVAGPPPPPVPPHPFAYAHPPHPGFSRPPPPSPPPPPRPGAEHVFRGPVPPIPAALMAGPRNVERQLA